VTPVRVKICGITRPEDALAAVQLGANALGFVFWPNSPRLVSQSSARVIASSVPVLVARVGVFVNASAEEVRRVVDHVGLDVVQLHGGEAVDDYRAIPARLIKAVTLESDDDVDRAARLPEHVTVLVDATDPVRRGGTGREADWSLAATLARRRPIMLAGGLRSDNVMAAVQAVQPWAIDVSSGVETSPGVKSPEKLAELFQVVKEHL
jgi:phosphoribosylanthranilate isomerase